MELAQHPAALLSGEETPQQFLQALLSADQEDLYHNRAEQVAAILQEPKIVAMFQRLDERSRQSYGLLVSISLFHTFQNRAQKGGIEGTNPSPEVASAFIYAQHYLGPTDSWTLYMKATDYYLSGSIRELKGVLSQMKQTGDKNVIVVQRLFEGLDRRKSPNYSLDYPVY